MPLRKATISHNAPVYLNDYICNTVKTENSLESLPCAINYVHTLTNSCITPKHICFSSLSHHNPNMLALLSSVIEPQTYEETINIHA